MKVLFLYKDERHAWPLLKSCFCLSKDTVESHQAFTPESVLEYKDFKYDVLLIHQELLSDEVVETFNPIVILEKIDGAQLAASRKWISHSHVKGVFKGYNFVNPELHLTYRGRAFPHHLHAWGCQATRNSRMQLGIPEQVSFADLDKIKVFYGFGAYQKLEHIRDCVPFSTMSKKKYSIFFAGTVLYDGSEVETHRKLALQKAKEIPNSLTGEGKVFPYEEYVKAIRDSEFVLCPFGWGEATHREYEAMLVGSYVIKPYVYNIEAWPDIYHNPDKYDESNNVAFCNPDFSDLEEVMEDARATRTDDILLGNYELASSAIRSPNIASRFEELLREVI